MLKMHDKAGKTVYKILIDSKPGSRKQAESNGAVDLKVLINQ